MSVTYPSGQEAKQQQRTMRGAVEAIQNKEYPGRDEVAWPKGMPSSLIRGLILPAGTRTALLRSRLLENDQDGLTVGMMLDARGIGTSTVRNLVRAADAFLSAYARAFRTPPGPGDIAAWRLKCLLRALPRTEWKIIEQRRFTDPPVPLHTVSMRTNTPVWTISNVITQCRDAIDIALGPELRELVDELAGAAPAVSEEEVMRRIEAWMGAHVPSTRAWERTARVLRAALRNEMLESARVQNSGGKR